MLKLCSFRYAVCGIIVRSLNSLFDFTQGREEKQSISKGFYSFVSLFYNNNTCLFELVCLALRSMGVEVDQF